MSGEINAQGSRIATAIRDAGINQAAARLSAAIIVSRGGPFSDEAALEVFDSMAAKVNDNRRRQPWSTGVDGIALIPHTSLADAG